MHCRAVRQQQGVGRPGQYRGQDPEVADVQREFAQALPVTVGDDAEHADEGNQNARGFATVQTLALDQPGNQHDHDRHEGVQQCAVDCRGVLQAAVDQHVVAAGAQCAEKQQPGPGGAQLWPVATHMWQGKRQQAKQGHHPAPEGQRDGRQFATEGATYRPSCRPRTGWPASAGGRGGYGTAFSWTGDYVPCAAPGTDPGDMSQCACARDGIRQMRRMG